MNQKEKIFCKIYSEFDNAKDAAINAGFSATSASKKALKLLTKPEIQKEIQKNNSLIDNDQLAHWAISVIRRLVFCKPNDVIKLILNNENLTDSQIDKLELFPISEFKKLKDGSFEVKFIDKLKAIAFLIDLANSFNNSDKENSFLSALKSASDSNVC